MDSLRVHLARYLLQGGLGLLLAVSTFAAAVAQDENVDEESPWLPGLIATYTVAEGSGCVRVDEQISFDWQAASPDSRIPPGRFKVEWKGRLRTQGTGQYKLLAYVQGNVSVRLAGREIISGQCEKAQWLASEPIELGFDYHELEVRFEKTANTGQIRMFWQGPGFVLEPLPDRFLFHAREDAPDRVFERGQLLAAALRCDACHAAHPADFSPAPALDRLAGNINRQWIVEWLSAAAPQVNGQIDARSIERRMPHFGLTRDDANAIAEYLLQASKPRETNKDTVREIKKPAARDSESKDQANKSPLKEGERLFLTLGCLACHKLGEFGESGLFGGGDLTRIAAKRPPDFFERWLADPARINQHHRMPVFQLTADERRSLSEYLREQGQAAAVDPVKPKSAVNRDVMSRGRQLVQQHRCDACHELPEKPASRDAVWPLDASRDWSRSCAGKANVATHRPGYQLTAADAKALQTFYSTLRPGERSLSEQDRGQRLLAEQNCLACHARDGIDRASHGLPARLQDKLAGVAAVYDSLAKEVPAMTPPALNSVGDKLHDDALAAAIRRPDEPHRPYLHVRMPKFRLTDEQTASIVAHLTTTDRIPPLPPNSNQKAGPLDSLSLAALAAAGPRLVTTDGFSCTSCHQVGSVPPDKAPLNARGPSLTMLEKRIRRPWFDRWCYGPARIVPRMEMPSVQVPVRGVLNDNVNDQLAAVWHILNTPGFEPPEPSPVRVLRLSGLPERNERPIVLHDVIKDGERTYLFPLVIGLPNRHNVLFDLETGRLAAWWLGDTARQQTKGKTWYWELGGKPIYQLGQEENELSFVPRKETNVEEYEVRRGKFSARLRKFQGASLKYGLSLVPTYKRKVKKAQLSGADVEQQLEIDHPQPEPGVDRMSGFLRTLIIRCDQVEAVRLRLVDADMAAECRWDQRAKSLSLPGDAGIVLQVLSEAQWEQDGYISVAPRKENEDAEQGDAWIAEFKVRYTTTTPVDAFLTNAPAPFVNEPSGVEIAPGFVGERLALPDDIMPSGLDWRPDGRLAFTTLKGQVYAVAESANASEPPKIDLVMDGLPTPYGIACEKDADYVSMKTGFLRLDYPQDKAPLARIISSSWGVTDDYHDWAVGLVRDGAYGYYVALPCQQDERIASAAFRRGKLLRLERKKIPNLPPERRYYASEISSGHRFPMGMAVNRDGELFVTDNQGNYNPFNELNHVRQGAHFGFINVLEKKQGYEPPPLTEPAINIPHPWTRSVNGICFLNEAFGPLDGHLIGCEYDTRRLIRMTLQKVGDTYQGAAYPLSIPPDDVERGLLGPLVCAVSPRGELYVGNIRDSGWGAGNNVGDIVKIRFEPEKLPCGIQEVQATSDGFTIDFFRPVDARLAADPASYSVVSYRRESTPAYGGPNLDRRIETIESIRLSDDRKQVVLHLPELRPGFVYEFQLKKLSSGKELFHPAEAHYTLRQIPRQKP